MGECRAHCHNLCMTQIRGVPGILGHKKGHKQEELPSTSQRATVHTHTPVAYACPAGHNDEEGSGASLSGGEAGGAGPV